MWKKRSAWALVFTLLPALAPAARADVVLDWNNVLLAAIRTDKTPPPKAARAMAMTHVAIFDAVDGLLGGYKPYAVTAPAPAGASPEAAAVTAAYHVISFLYPDQQLTFDAALRTSLAAIPEGPARVAGGDWGIDVAALIESLRAADGARATVAYTPPTGALWWTATPPAFAAALLPQWPRVTPWAMPGGAHFRAGAPPNPASDEYLRAFREVSRLGRANSPYRTAEQTQIALYWADGAGTATPPGHWNVIARRFSASRHLSLLENARLFALLGLAEADAGIVAWDDKYAYNVWRPVTGIQHAEGDGNAETVADPGWLPLLATPPFPSYVSGHSTFSAAAARILALFAGGDAFSFSDSSDGLPNVNRSFTSFSQAAAEAGQSRIYGGIHWQFDNQAGFQAGTALGELVYFKALTPVVAPGPCSASFNASCLAGDRFQVEATWKTATAAGVAHAAPPGPNAGRFWFFDEENPELTVKVLDTCGGFGRFWVFASGLTNVEVTLKVTDTRTGQVRFYFNPQGQAFQPVQDTDAFATCS